MQAMTLHTGELMHIVMADFHKDWRQKMVFGKLNKLRAEHKKALQKLNEAQKKVDEAAARVKEAENMEILSFIDEKKITPEQLYELVNGKENTSNEGNKDFKH